MTVTGDADGKINIGVKCGETDTLEAKDYDVTDGKATSDAFDAPAAADAAVTCTATASGKVGGEDETGTGSFDIAAAGGGLMAYTGAALAGTTSTADIDDGDTLTFTANKPDSGGELVDADKVVTLQVACVADGAPLPTDDSAWSDAPSGAGVTATNLVDGDPNTQVTSTITIATAASLDDDTSADPDCFVRACANIGVESGSRAKLCAVASELALGN